ncbi:MAG: hypothetical protein Satyrvirus1_54 [Satyrvirus sp.]|uniref:Uncharacterized protein n=1 Tax=Satyrvirus sp. TaxID=2487771 RepID=A0A3G5ACK4_9VIRU|nr:MAG: hypothetical protein Satyrvirus1_54 [Satyrvirus sp.]
MCESENLNDIGEYLLEKNNNRTISYMNHSENPLFVY